MPELWSLVSIPYEWKEKFFARIETWENEESEATRQEVQRVKDELASIKAKIDRINAGFTDGSLDLAEFKELKNPLVPKRAELEQKLIALEKSKANRLEPLWNWIWQANQAETWAAEDNWLEMKKYLQQVGSNRLLRSETVTVSFTTPASLLAETTVAVRSTNDVSDQCSIWWRRRELKSSGGWELFSRWCAVRDKTGMNKGVRAGLDFVPLNCHRAQQRKK